MKNNVGADPLRALEWALDRELIPEVGAARFNKLLFIHPPHQPNFPQIVADKVLLLSPFATDKFSEAPGVTRIDSWPNDLDDRSVAVIFFGESKEEARAILNSISSLALPPKVVIGVAQNHLGSNHISNIFAEYFESCRAESKHHCKVLIGSVPRPLSPADSLRYGEMTKIGENPLFSSPGIFSRSSLDNGSSFLIDSISALPETPGIDLGSGYGYLEWGLARKGVRINEITVVENDLRALNCSKKNLADLSNIGAIEYRWGDFRSIPEAGRYKWCLLNPPFHFRGSENLELGRAAFKAAYSLLDKGGELFVVYNSHLPYNSIIEELFKPLSKLFERGGFIGWHLQR